MTCHVHNLERCWNRSVFITMQFCRRQMSEISNRSETRLTLVNSCSSKQRILSQPRSTISQIPSDEIRRIESHEKTDRLTTAFPSPIHLRSSINSNILG